MNHELTRRTLLTDASPAAMATKIRTESEAGDVLFNEHHRAYELILDDRNAFARQMFSELYNDGEDRIGEHAPAERQAYDALKRQVRERITDPETSRLFELMAEAAYAYAGESFDDGIAFGHVTEEFRQSLLGLHEARISKGGK